VREPGVDLLQVEELLLDARIGFHALPLVVRRTRRARLPVVRVRLGPRVVTA
jgi:hypothetical protein